MLQKEFGGDIPDSVEGLVRLPGVGPKMAHLAMDIAWDQVSGIGMDVNLRNGTPHIRMTPLHHQNAAAPHLQVVDLLFFPFRCGHTCSSHLQQTRLAQEDDKDSRGHAEVSGGVAPQVTMVTSS